MAWAAPIYRRRPDDNALRWLAFSQKAEQFASTCPKSKRCPGNGRFAAGRRQVSFRRAQRRRDVVFQGPGDRLAIVSLVEVMRGIAVLGPVDAPVDHRRRGS